MKVVITDLDIVSIENETKAFRQAGISFVLKQLHTEEELIDGCCDADILLVQYAKITRRVMEALPKIKLIVRYGVGVDSIDLAAATEHGIQVCNVPDYGVNEVAGHAVALALSLVRKIDLLNQRTKMDRWDYSACIPIHRFSAMTVGVVGLGRIGRNFAQKMSALGFHVLGYDPFYHETPETKEYIEEVSFDDLVSRADIVSLHCPADGNEKIMSRDVFKKMKNSAILINVARGALVCDEDLDAALQEGEIAAAGLDTVSIEPAPTGYFLFRHDNLLVTPHMAWYSEEAGHELQRKVAEEAVLYAEGKGVRYPVNKLDKH